MKWIEHVAWLRPLPVTLRLSSPTVRQLYLMPERHDFAESQGNWAKGFSERPALTPWLAAEKHVYLTLNWFKQRFPCARLLVSEAL